MGRDWLIISFIAGYGKVVLQMWLVILSSYVFSWWTGICMPFLVHVLCGYAVILVHEYLTPWLNKLFKKKQQNEL